MPPTARTHSVLFVFLVAAHSLLLACTEPLVLGSTPPEAFQFTVVVAHDGVETGGWKVAQVVILLGKLSPRYPDTTFCEVEVGVPEVNRKGPVPNVFAQVEAAVAADEAARHVLKKKLLPTAVACDELRKKMQSHRTERESWTRFPPLPPEFHAHEENLASLIQSVLGFTRLPNEVLFTPVPDLHPLRSQPHSRAAWLEELLFG